MGKKIRTAKEVLEQQKRDHEKPRNVPAKAASTVVANKENNPWIEIGGVLAEHLGAPLLKFTKDGEFALTDDKTVAAGTRCIAHVDEVEFGWNKWQDGQIVERRTGRVADRYLPLQRAELGDTDERAWEAQPDGSRRDPWQFTATMPLTRCDNDESLNFTTGSKGGLGAVGGLTRTYGKRVAKGLPGRPIVELRPGDYKHRQYGKIYFPQFHIVSWADADGAPLSLADDLNDAIPEHL
jgi:hypothetical protein